MLGTNEGTSVGDDVIVGFWVIVGMTEIDGDTDGAELGRALMLGIVEGCKLVVGTKEGLLVGYDVMVGLCDSEGAPEGTEEGTELILG